MLTSFIGHAGRRGWRVLAGVLLSSFHTLVGGCRADEHTGAGCRLPSLGARWPPVVGLRILGVFAVMVL